MSFPIIEFTNFSFSYYLRNERALSNLTLKINENDFVLITGENGSGKSTLCYALIGLIPYFYAGQSEGSVFVKGEKVENQSISELSTSIGYIPQKAEKALITPYVLTELAFPLENKNIQRKAIHERIKDIIVEYDIANLLKHETNKISEGEKQKVVLASSLALEPNIILADEPLANLDKKNQKRTLSALEKLYREGKTVIIVTHEIEMYLDLATKVVVLEKGELKEEHNLKDENKNISIVEQNQKQPKNPQNNRNVDEYKEEENIISIQNISYSPSSFFNLNVNLDIKENSVVAFIGDNGSGKTTLLKLITGLIKPDKGTIYVKGTDINKIKDREKPKIFGVVFQNPEQYFFTESVIKEVKLQSINIKKPIIENEIFQRLEKAKILPLAEVSAHSLSEGEKRKLAFLAAIEHDPSIIILDEITNGLDTHSKQWLYDEIKNLKEKGKTVIIASHDEMFVEDVADKVIWVENGLIKKQNSTENEKR